MSHQTRKIARNIAHRKMKEDGYRQVNKPFRMKGRPASSMFQLSWRNSFAHATGCKLPEPKKNRKRRKAT